MEQRVLNQLIDHYWESYPQEAVGVLLRDASILKLRNWSYREDRFLSTNLRILIRLGWRAWRHGTGISYFYHSHSQSTRPSQVDQVFMKVLYERWPHVTHLIFTPDGRYDLWEVD